MYQPKLPLHRCFISKVRITMETFIPARAKRQLVQAVSRQWYQRTKDTSNENGVRFFWDKLLCCSVGKASSQVCHWGHNTTQVDHWHLFKSLNDWYGIYGKYTITWENPFFKNRPQWLQKPFNSFQPAEPYPEYSFHLICWHGLKAVLLVGITLNKHMTPPERATPK